MKNTRTATPPPFAKARDEDHKLAPGSRVAAILNAAERVFGVHGYAGASMRQIAEEAGVAQALLHYHYASKDKLYEAIFERRSSAINQYRGKCLDDLLTGNVPATVEDVLRIAFTPLSEIFCSKDADSLAPYVQMIATISLGNDERSRRLREQYYDPIAHRFIDAIQTVLPGISRENAVWSYLFSVGARQQAHAMNGRAARLDATARPHGSTSHYPSLVAFAAAGIRAIMLESEREVDVSPRQRGTLAAHLKEG